MKLRHLLITPLFFLGLSGQAQDQAVLDRITEEAIQERIEQHRMGEIIIRTKPGAEVRIEQTRHEFLFGTAIPNHLAENSEEPMSKKERKQFMRILEDNFNYAVHENAMKWYDTEKVQGEVDYSVADRIWELADSVGIPMRGHCVYWEKDEFNSEWLKQLDNDALRKAVVQRADSLINHFKGRIHEYDLNNEMIHGNFFRRKLGWGVINEMAWLVKAHDPDAKLYLNDYGILDIGLNAGAYEMQVERLLNNGVPIDGIGMQAHRTIRGEIHNSRYMVQRNLDRFNRFNLPIKITEALFAYDTEEKRASELRKLFPIYFAHPNVEAIVMWGVWEKVHWVPYSAMWKSDFSPTLQSEAYRDLVFNEWWTDETLKADKKGEIRLKAFYGNYKISSANKTEEVALEKARGSLSVEL